MTVKTATDDAPSLSPGALDYFRKLIDDRIGIQLEGKEYLIASRLQPLLREFSAGTAEELVGLVRSGDHQAEAAVIDAMTTNETSFFRDQHPFETLATDVLPKLFDRSPTGRLTIWNGACSSGQESYTLAMTIQEHFPTMAKRVRILSTDVSPVMVKRTGDGLYSRFEINRGLSAPLALKYFDQIGRNWVAKPSLREMIDAKELNLLKPWPSVPKCDVVLLRNVLIYFTVETKRDILNRIRTTALDPHGYLLLGASESTANLDDGFVAIRVAKSTFHRPKGAV